ncbi:MAG: CoA transferase [Aliidongia sp.]
MCGAAAEHGAEVIRIEKREGSEDRFQVPLAATGEGGLFLQMKPQQARHDARPDGRGRPRRRAQSWVATADIVVANLPPQTLAAMGLDYETLRAIKPDIILTTLSALRRGRTL